MLGNGCQLVVADLPLQTVGDVFPHGAADKRILLGHHRELVAPIRQVIVANVLVAKADLAAFRLVQPRHQLEQGGFAGTVAADHGGHLAHRDFQRQIFDHILLVRIAKGDIVKHNVRAQGGNRLAIPLLGGGIHHLRDLFHGTKGAGHRADIHKELHQLHGHDAGDHIKAGEVADGDLAAGDQLTADHKHNDDEQNGKQTGRQLVSGHHQPAEEIRDIHPLERTLALFGFQFFRHGTFDQPEMAHPLGQIAHAARHGGGAERPQLKHQLAVDQAHQQRQRNDDERIGGKHSVVIKQLDKRLDRGHHAHHTGDRGGKQRCRRFRIRSDTADQLVAAVRVVITGGQPHDLAPQLHSHPQRDDLFHFAGKIVVANGKCRRNSHHRDIADQLFGVDRHLAGINNIGGHGRHLQLGVHHGDGAHQAAQNQQPRQLYPFPQGEIPRDMFFGTGFLFHTVASPAFSFIFR